MRQRVVWVWLACFLAPVVARGEHSLGSDGEASVLVAEAAVAAASGELEQARTLLRAALAVDPSHERAAFELAQLVERMGAPAAHEDYAPILRLPAPSADVRLLRAHVFVRQGRVAAARADLAQVLAEHPDHHEAVELERLIAAASTPAAPERPEVSGRLRVGGQLDTNVMVVPEQGTDTALGVQPSFEGALQARLLDGPTSLDLGGAARYVPNVVNRDELGAYDQLWVVGLATLQSPDGPVVWHATASVAEALLDSRRPFLTAGDVRATGLWRGDVLSLGAYARAGYRDFRAQAGDVGNDEGGLHDRDGPRLSAGARALLERSAWRLLLDVGWQLERAQGEWAREQGPEADGSVRFQASSWSVGTGVRYELRAYTDDPLDRRDHRYTLHADAAYELRAGMALRVWYARTRNHAPAGHDYARQILQSGLEVAL